MIEFLCYGGWHLCLYGGFGIRGFGFEPVVQDIKFNPINQYSASHNLRREITYTTLGFLMSSACVTAQHAN